MWELGAQLAELASAADERAQRGRPLPLRPRQAQGHEQARNPKKSLPLSAAVHPPCLCMQRMAGVT